MSRDPITELFVEAERQLTICNACRYCAGYCPVWPALELRTTLGEGDLTHLANLCHDCRDCFTACMYTAPHEFDLNPPKVFTRLREETYHRYARPRLPFLSGRLALLGWFVALCGLLTLLSYATTGRWLTVDGGSGSPYAVLPHWLMVTSAALPSGWAVGVFTVGVVRYWRDTHGPLRGLLRLRLWPRAIGQAAQLRHMRGGGQDCDYSADAAVDEKPSPARRLCHLAVSYGFGLCVVSTASAAFTQEFLGLLPPYPYLSVPVVTGTLGGIVMVVGCTGLVELKRRSDPALGTASMRRADYGFLWALLVLAVSGLLTLLFRETPIFGPVLVAHLAAVIIAFAIAPYTKFVHWIYRLLAIYKSNLDSADR